MEPSPWISELEWETNVVSDKVREMDKVGVEAVVADGIIDK